jgi:hypothetical protein
MEEFERRSARTSAVCTRAARPMVRMRSTPLPATRSPVPGLGAEVTAALRDPAARIATVTRTQNERRARRAGLR